MAKKLIGLGITIVMLLSVAVFTACELPDTGFAEYQAAAVTALTEYVEALDKDDFNAENWARIEGYLEDGIAKINAAENRAAVRYARDAAKDAIGAVEKRPVPTSSFYTLRNAYNSGLLTRSDIEHMAYFRFGEVIEIFDHSLIEGTVGYKWIRELSWPESEWTTIRRVDFTPQMSPPVAVADLDPQTVSRIKEAYSNWLRERDPWIDKEIQLAIESGSLPEGSTFKDTLSIIDFFGIYNGFYTVRMTTSRWGYGDEPIDFSIGDIAWGYGGHGPITMLFTNI